MDVLRYTTRLLLVTLLIMAGAAAQNWADLNHYRDANARLSRVRPTASRVVFMGNSITESWGKFDPRYFAAQTRVNRGISGQTTPQMLLRFRADVIDLKPAVVLILAGTNDIAGNTGPLTLEETLANIKSMAELAQLHGIAVMLGSVLPAISFSWVPELQPAEQIEALNQMIKAYADQNGFGYLDYYSALVNNQKGLQDRYSLDGVHPNQAGYQVMEKLTEAALARLIPAKH